MENGACQRSAFDATPVETRNVWWFKENLSLSLSLNNDCGTNDEAVVVISKN